MAVTIGGRQQIQAKQKPATPMEVDGTDTHTGLSPRRLLFISHVKPHTYYMRLNLQVSQAVHFKSVKKKKNVRTVQL